MKQICTDCALSHTNSFDFRSFFKVYFNKRRSGFFFYWILGLEFGFELLKNGIILSIGPIGIVFVFSIPSARASLKSGGK